jgi:hypothetical protein
MGHPYQKASQDKKHLEKNRISSYEVCCRTRLHVTYMSWCDAEVKIYFIFKQKLSDLEAENVRVAKRYVMGSRESRANIWSTAFKLTKVKQQMDMNKTCWKTLDNNLIYAAMDLVIISKRFGLKHWACCITDAKNWSKIRSFGEYYSWELWVRYTRWEQHTRGNST